MNEKLLQFIWQYSLYIPAGLTTLSGEAVTVIHPGRLNTHAGPDFEEARVKIGDTILVGHIEVHVRSGDWRKHGHEGDDAYKNIILHVVYEHDGQMVSNRFPTLELHRYIPGYVIDQYTNLIQTAQTIPCGQHLEQVPQLVWENWLSRLLAERWEQRLGEWKELLDASAGDWRSLLYRRMATNFGFKVNGVPFLLLARATPLNVLARHKDNIVQVEALLFGQAGLLNGNFEEDYPRVLQKEYQYLRQKYSLQPIEGHLWKFLRMRPANFPTVRIAQFAMLVHQSLHLFSHIIEAASVKEIEPLLDITASVYWDTHVRWGECQDQSSPKNMGMASVQNIIINTIAPLQFLYAHQSGDVGQQERALQLLSSVPPEQNSILRLWGRYGVQAANAAESQSLLQLFNSYCGAKKCLECAVGLRIIRSRPVE